MKKAFLVTILVTVVAVAAFFLGRLSAPAPRFISQSEGDLAAAFEEFQRGQRDTLALMQAHPLFADPQMRAEAYRSVLYATVGSIRTAALTDLDHPRFIRATDWSAKSGLDNPDNNYYFARIRDDEDYVIRGQRGSSRNLIFQLVVGQPGVRDAGSSTNVSVLNAWDMQIEDDGTFEILVSRENPGDGRNWLANGPGAETLMARMTFSDWQAEHKGYLTIEKARNEGLPKPVLTPEEMAFRLREVAVHMYDRTASWLQLAERAWLARQRNAMTAPTRAEGGLVGQWWSFGSWQLEDDEALIIRSHRSNASYQGIELGNRWFVSLDYETRTSSLTLDQAEVASDGSYYFVVSGKDPGIYNWLDTEAHESGLIMMRWQGLTGDLPEAQSPRAWKVPLAEIEQHLPADTRYISSADRRAQIAARRMALQRRDAG